jgi:hypothetical protein
VHTADIGVKKGERDMAEYQAFVGDTNNSSIGDINVLVDLPVVGTHTATSVTYTSTDPVYAGVSVVLTGTGFLGAGSGWVITGVEAFHNGHAIWDITGLSNSVGNNGVTYSGEPVIDGTPLTGSFDHHSIFQAADLRDAPHLMFAGVNNDIYGGPGDEGLFGFGRSVPLRTTVTVHGSTGTELIGGDGGNAILYAGTGHDAFLFNYNVLTATASSAPNLSTIHGFNPSKDILELSHGDFQRTHFGVLTAAEFHVGMSSTSGADIVYNHANGHLYYDSNGAAAGGLHLFAILTNHPTLIPSDFIVA